MVDLSVVFSLPRTGLFCHNRSPDRLRRSDGLIVWRRSLNHPVFAAKATTPAHVTDRLERPLRDLRISVTDRCNFRCVYCMPKEVFGKDYQFLEHK